MAKVLLKFKDALVKEIPLDKDLITIGRKAENDIAVDNQAVSGFHAKIFKDSEGFSVEDLNSLNGTFVNGQKVAKTPLNNGDVILIGVHTLEVVVEPRKGVDATKDRIRGRSMDETMVIDPKDQQKIIASTEKVDVLGGFIIIEGSSERKDYELKDRVSTIGKDDSAVIRLKGFFAPQVAALVNRRKEGYFISPSGGKSIKVNGREISNRYDLKDGDIVEVSSLKMQFYIKE
jgi:pSer/pThr/pTyr-binding forkhead associated (FHA) protein